MTNDPGSLRITGVSPEYRQSMTNVGVMEGVLERIRGEAELALEELNSWTSATRQTTPRNYSGDFFYKRPTAFETLSDTVSEGRRALNARECALHMELDKVKDQRNQLDKALLLRPDPEQCYCESLVTTNPTKEWGGADYKEVCTRQTVFNVDKGWVYSSATPVYTTYYRNGGHAIRHISHE